MAARPLTEEEKRKLASPGGVRALTDEERAQVEPSLPRRILSTAERGARQIVSGVGQATGTRGLMQRVGAALPNEIDPATGREQITPIEGGLRMVGMAAPIAGGIAAGGARLATAAPDAARAIAAQTGGLAEGARQFVTSQGAQALAAPRAFAAAEGGAAMAAGTIGQAFENQTGSPTVRFIAEMSAGMAAGAASPVLAAAMRISPLISLVKGAARRVTGREAATSSQAGRSQAAERVRAGTRDPQQTALAAQRGAEEVIPGAQLTLAELAEEPGLLSLQQSIARSSDTLSATNQERVAAVNDLSRATLQGATRIDTDDVNPQEARAFLDSLIEERIQIARIQTEEAVARLGPNAPREQANRIARQKIDEALDAARTQERELYAAADLTVPAAPTTAARETENITREVMSNRARDVSKVLPAQARRFLGRVDPESGEFIPGDFLTRTSSLDELVTLRSELLGSAARERAKPAPDRFKLSVLARLDDALLQDMSVADSTDQALATARAFSRDLNQRFRQGDVGDILGFEVTREASVPPSLTLETTIGRPGMRAAEAADQLMRAVQVSGDPPAMQQAISDFLTDEFLRASQRGGDFNPTLAQNYLARRQDVLSRFPELRQRLEAATAAGDAQMAAEGLRNPRQSPAAVVLRAPPGKEIERLLSSPRPREATQQVIGLLNTDGTQRALPAMRHAFVDFLLERSTNTGQQLGDAGLLSGVRLRDLMASPAVQQVAETLLTPAQRRTIDRVVATQTRLERGMRAPESAEGILTGPRHMLAELGRRFAAASLGRQAGRAAGSGGTVQIPGQFVRVADEMAARGLDPARTVLVDAVMSPNPDLLRALLLETPTGPRRRRMIEAPLNAWALAAAQQYGIDLAGGSDEQ